MSARLIVALDTADPAQARAWAKAVAPWCALIKLGLEFFTANGPAGVRGIGGPPMFLDLKLHDIPTTVARAVEAALSLGPRMLTVHAAGGPAMLTAARRAAEQAGTERPLLLAVTVLTSLNEADLAALGATGGTSDQVLRLGRLAIAAGADGLVCSAHELSALRTELGHGVKLVVPGIRPAGTQADDQTRTMTPERAVAVGADWIVVGRPITGAADSAAAAAAISRALV
jgi:orotidine-5'-phosphate decarboxylase